MQCVVCHHSTFRMLFDHVGTCTTCGLAQKTPMLTKKEVSRLYHDDLEHFDPYIQYLAVHHAYFQKKAMIVHKGDRVLDIGCAMGVFLEEAKKRGATALGVDISKDAVSYCRKKGLRVSTAWPTTKFDVICAFEVIEHERDPLAMMRRIHKLLKNGGEAVITTPNHSSFWRKLMGKWWVGYTHPEHVVFFDPKSLIELFTRAGFTDIRVDHDTPRPFPLSFAFRRSADYFPWAGWVVKPIGNFLDRWHILNPVNPWDDLIVYGKK